MIFKIHACLCSYHANQRERGRAEGRKKTHSTKKKLFVFLPICLCGWARNDSSTSRFEISATSAASLSFCQLETLHLDEVGQLECSLQFLPRPSCPCHFLYLFCPSFQCLSSCTSRFLNPPPVVHPNTFKISLFIALFRLMFSLAIGPRWDSSLHSNSTYC